MTLRHLAAASWTRLRLLSPRFLSPWMCLIDPGRQAFLFFFIFYVSGADEQCEEKATDKRQEESGII